MIWYSANTVEEAERVLNEELKLLENYFKMNYLMLNTSKTKYIVICKRSQERETCIKIGSETIERVKSLKYLGITIDDKLTFKEHFKIITTKIAKKVNYLGRRRNKLDRDTKVLLYKSMIMPHLDFCATVLFMMNEEELRTIQKLQNKALRIMLNKTMYTPRREMLESAKIMSVKQRIKYNVLIMMYKITNKMVPEYLTRNMKTVQESQPYNLRNKNRYKTINFTTAKGRNSLFYKGTTLYNEFLKNNTVENLFVKDRNKIEKYVYETTEI